MVRLDPPKEMILTHFLHEEGINITVGEVKLAYRVANYWLKQTSSKLRSHGEKRDFLIGYNVELFKILGLSSKAGSWAERLLHRFEEQRRWVLFPDTTSALTCLEERGFLQGIVANWDSGLTSLLKQLGIDHLFASIVSSADAGAEKPCREIFLLALEEIGASPNDTYHVGNDYDVDVIGARSAGIEPILIDRDNIVPFADCLRFTDLSQMCAYVSGTS